MSYNKVILIGFSGKDAETRTFQEGRIASSFTLATTEYGYTAANGTVVPDVTQWHNIVAYDNTFVRDHVRKGSGLKIEGKIRYRDYTDKSGQKKNITEVVAEKVEFFSFGRKEK